MNAREAVASPLFRDPIHDGATDPTIVFHQQNREWWMFYTARRADTEGPGVAWVHGTDIGIAVSTDHGANWTYRGTATGLDFEPGRNTYWAPEVLWAEDRYHMFVSYVRGVPERWEGHDRKILHYVSYDLASWWLRGPCELGSDRVIDAAVLPLPTGGYRMWFKDEEHGSHTYAADSADLEAWGTARPVITDREHEGPNVFEFGAAYWLLVDEWRGLGVYRSTDLETWDRNGSILDVPGNRADDHDIGRHADVVVIDQRAYIIYFTHPELYVSAPGEKQTYRHRRSSIQVAALDLEHGRLTCDRDAFVPAAFLAARSPARSKAS